MRSESERLVADYSDLILRLSYTYLGSIHDAEDICQTVLIKLITTAPGFSSKEHEKAWVIRVTANTCKDLLRSAARRRTVRLDALERGGRLGGGEGFGGNGGFAENRLDRSGGLTHNGEPSRSDLGIEAEENPVLQAVQCLVEEQREAIYLHYYEGYKIKEIASITQASPAAIAKRLSRARETLRTILGGCRHEQ